MQTVHVRVNDAATGKPTPCRIRFTDADGRYYAPFGRLTEFSTWEYEDVGGNLLLDNKEYAYIDGTCEIRLPASLLTVEVAKGFEYKPLYQELQLGAGKLALRFGLERWTDFRKEGWRSGDICARALTPHAAALEGAAEDLAVVNLLAEEVILFGYDLETGKGKFNYAVPNILAFSGQQPAVELAGSMVVVNTANRAGILGQVALLNCHRPVFPLVFARGGDERAVYDWTVADWCDQCHRKRGLVVGYAFGIHDVVVNEEPRISGGELLADLILGKIDAIDLVYFESRGERGTLSDWRAVLNAGFRVPLASGSWKEHNGSLIGRPRTYARLQPDQEFTYKNWIEAIRAGRTFVTTGPLLTFTVNGQDAGAVIELPSSAKTVRVQAKTQALCPLSRLEILCNGAVVAGADVTGTPAHAAIEIDLPLSGPAWLAACCWRADNEDTDISYGAHSSAIYVQVDGQPLRPDAAAAAPLLAWLNRVRDWFAQEARYEDERQRQRLIAVFEAARQELLRRQNG